MPRIKLENGENLDLPEEQFLQALGSKEHAGSRVWMQRPNGTYTTVPMDQGQLSTAIGTGFSVAKENVLAERDRVASYGEGTANELKAGALGFGRGLTLGASDVAVSALAERFPNALPSKEEINLYREQNPAASTIGEMAGIVAPAIASAGSSLGAGVAARGAAEVAGAAGFGSMLKAGAAKALSVAPPALMERGVQALGPGLGKQIVARALEGSVYGATGAADSAFLRGQPITDELASGAGLGALIGGSIPVAGAALSVVGRRVGGAVTDWAESRLAKKAAGVEDRATSKSAMDDLVSAEAKGMDDVQLEAHGFSPDEISRIKTATPGEKLEPAIQAKINAEIPVEHLRADAGLFENMYAGVAGELSSMKEPEILALMGSGAAGKEARKVAENADSFLDAIARSMGGIEGSETGLNRVMRRVSEFSRKLKPKGMKALVKDEFDDATVQGSWEVLQGLQKEIGAVSEGGRAVYANPKQAKFLQELVGHEIKNLESAIQNQSMSDVFMALDNAKRAYGRFTASLYRGSSEMMATGQQVLGAQAEKTAALYEQHYHTLLGILEDPKAWGEAAAEAQTQINRSWTAYLGAQKSRGTPIYRGWKPVRDARNSNFEQQFVADAGDLRSVFDKLNKPSGDLDYIRLMELQSTRNELVQKTIKYYKLTDEKIWGSEALSAGEVKGLFGKNNFEPGQRWADLANKSPDEIIQGVFEQNVSKLAEAKKIRALGDLWQKNQKSSQGLLISKILSPSFMVGVEKKLDKFGNAVTAAASSIAKAHEDALSSVARTQEAALKGMGRAQEAALGGIGKAHGAAVESIAQTQASSQTMSGIGATARATASTLYRIISKSKKFMGLVTPAAVPAAAWEAGKSRIPDKKLDEIVKNPRLVKEAIKKANLAEAAPHADRLISLIMSKAPRPKPQRLLDQLRGENPKIDARELAAWKRDTLEIVLDPSSIMDRMESNSLQAKHVAVLAEAYPQLYPALAQQYKVWLGQTKSIPRQKARQISIFLGESLTGSSDIQLAAANQVLYQTPQEAGSAPAVAAGGGPGKPLSGIKAQNLGKSIPMTETQRLETA